MIATELQYTCLVLRKIQPKLQAQHDWQASKLTIMKKKQRRRNLRRKRKKRAEAAGPHTPQHYRTDEAEPAAEDDPRTADGRRTEDDDTG